MTGISFSIISGICYKCMLLTISLIQLKSENFLMKILPRKKMLQDGKNLLGRHF